MLWCLSCLVLQHALTVYHPTTDFCFLCHWRLMRFRLKIRKMYPSPSSLSSFSKQTLGSPLFVDTFNYIKSSHSCIENSPFMTFLVYLKMGDNYQLIFECGNITATYKGTLSTLPQNLLQCLRVKTCYIFIVMLTLSSVFALQLLLTSFQENTNYAKIFISEITQKGSFSL